jgi:hypothetical protein
MDSLIPQHSNADFPWKPVQQFITVSDTAVILDSSDDYIRKIIIFLLGEGILTGEDLLELKPQSHSTRTVRKQYRQFRIHKETGLAKIKAYLAAQ